MRALRGTPRRVDENQAEIIKALMGAGCGVLDLSAVGGGCPDILVCHLGELYLLEIKNPKTRGKLNKLQQKWHDEWKGSPVRIVYCAEDALRAIGAI